MIRGADSINFHIAIECWCAGGCHTGNTGLSPVWDSDHIARKARLSSAHRDKNSGLTSRSRKVQLPLETDTNRKIVAVCKTREETREGIRYN